MIKIYNYLYIVINEKRIALDLVKTEKNSFSLCLNIYLNNCLMSSCVIPVTLVGEYFKLYINPKEENEIRFEGIHASFIVNDDNENVGLKIDSPDYSSVFALKNFTHGYF